MRTIIAGSRTLGYDDVALAMSNCGWKPTLVISGGALGVDQAAERWAKENDIPLLVMYADWGKYGKAAGYVRNSRMAQDAEALVAIWDGKSKGTEGMLKVARSKQLKVYLTNVEPKAPVQPTKRIRVKAV